MNKNDISIYASIDRLPKDSRDRLIREIKKNLSLNSSGLFTNNSNRLDSDSAAQVEDYLSEHFMGESFLVRVWICILNFFQRERRKEDIYKIYILKRLENSVNYVYKNPVIDFRKGYLHMGFVEMFFALYRHSVKLKEFFRMLENGNVVEQTMLEVIQSKIPNFKHKMEDFLESGEYEKFLKKEKSQNDLEEAIKAKISTYINSISLQTYKMVEDIFEFFYVLNSFAFFPYKSFFSFFNIEFLDDIENLDAVNLDNAISASFESVDKYFSGLFDLLYTLRSIEVNEDILRIIIKNYFFIMESDEDGILSEESLLKVDSAFKSIVSIMSKIISLAKTLPYLDVFKIYYKNPVLKPKKYIPYLDIRSFYENILFLNVNGQIVKKHSSTLKALMNREIKSLIKNYSVILDVNNLIFKGIDLEYSNFKKLYFLNEFFKTIYDITMMEVLKIVNNVVLVNNVDLRNSFISLEKNINTLRKEIYDVCFELNYRNEEYEKYKRDDKDDDSYREKILERCLNEINTIESLVINFTDYFIDLKKKYVALLENNNALIQSALNISYKLSAVDNEKISLAFVIGNVLSIMSQALFIVENL
ncbi:hypothetical protein [Candidatus Borreliella tachyglossi]|uniref:hypothetical protein n=1 Tax=Candidatus Borreliella tachyglossi TaxID=1964448 RepID=UPI0040421466